ncbi:MAG: Minf_1886 family protein [Pirellulales bacterium]
MLDPNHPIAQLARQDGRYSVEAYAFIFDSLNFAHSVLNMGAEASSEPDEFDEPATGRERHLTGQELCEAIRRYALHQYGYMAKVVLNSWGIHQTGDFGEIVFNMIRAGHMRKTPQDKREDFDDVYDFDKGLVEQFEINLQE